MAETGFWNIGANEPDRLAVVHDDFTETSYGELFKASNRIAHGLRKLGLEPGDGISVVLPNLQAFLELYYASMISGVYFTPVNYHLTGPEIAYILSDSEAKVFVAADRYAKAARAAVDEIGFPLDRAFAIGDIEGFTPYAELGAGQPETLPDDRHSGSPMLYTSGTTGRPKGVRRRLPEGTDPAAARGGGVVQIFGHPPGEGVHLVAGPLYHSAPLAFGTGSLSGGHTLVLMDRWTPEGTLERIQRYDVTSSHMVPTMFHRLLALPDEERRRYDVSSLKSVIHAAAPCPVNVKQRMIEWWGPVIWEYYGSTESSINTIVAPQDWIEHPGTVGKSLRPEALKILDEDGNECPPNVTGTIYFRGRGFEYHKDPEKTKSVTRGEYFTVGDMGYLDEDGWLFLNDRKADMIISGGVNIYPAEIEAVLLTHPKVGDAAVIGVPNEEWGEEVKAVVEPASGAVAGPDLAEEILQFCKERLAGFKCPRTVDFRSQLPRYPTGKLYKRLIRDDYWKGRDQRI